MSPPTTRTVGERAAARPAEQPGQRPLERDRVVDQRHVRGQGRARAGRGDDDDLGRDRPDRVDGVVDQRATVDRLGELVPAEPARAAAGQDDDADPVRRHRSPPAGRSGTGHVPRVRPAQDPSAVEVGEDGHDVLAAGARRVAEGGRGQRCRVTTSPAPGPPAPDRSSSHRPGRARGRGSGPPGRGRGSPSGGQPAACAASLSAGGAATASARSSRSIAAARVGSALVGRRRGSRAPQRRGRRG